MGLSTSDLPGLSERIELALPGIFPTDGCEFDHSCGGSESHIEKHPFREEVEQGTNIPHLLEHILLHLLSRRSCRCAGYCGQRSIDIEEGITTHYYIVLDCPSKLEAILATDLGFQLVSAWVEGRTVTIDPAVVMDGVHQLLEPMLHNQPSYVAS